MECSKSLLQLAYCDAIGYCMDKQQQRIQKPNTGEMQNQLNININDICLIKLKYHAIIITNV